MIVLITGAVIGFASAYSTVIAQNSYQRYRQREKIEAMFMELPTPSLPSRKVRNSAGFTVFTRTWATAGQASTLGLASSVASAICIHHDGDLSSHIDVQGKDETAQLLQALSRMNANLARIVGQVRPEPSCERSAACIPGQIVRKFEVVPAAALEREILWRLINGPQGGMVRQIGLADSRMSQIGRAVRWLRSHFAEPVRIDELAGVAGMSPTSLHRHFRGVTAMTPIQYRSSSGFRLRANDC